MRCKDLFAFQQRGASKYILQDVNWSICATSEEVKKRHVELATTLITPTLFQLSVLSSLTSQRTCGRIQSKWCKHTFYFVTSNNVAHFLHCDSHSLVWKVIVMVWKVIHHNLSVPALVNLISHLWEERGAESALHRHDSFAQLVGSCLCVSSQVTFASSYVSLFMQYSNLRRKSSLDLRLHERMMDVIVEVRKWRLVRCMLVSNVSQCCSDAF